MYIMFQYQKHMTDDENNFHDYAWPSEIRELRIPLYRETMGGTRSNLLLFQGKLIK